MPGDEEKGGGQEEAEPHVEAEREQEVSLFSSANKMKKFHAHAYLTFIHCPSVLLFSFVAANDDAGRWFSPATRRRRTGRRRWSHSSRRNARRR